MSLPIKEYLGQSNLLSLDVIDLPDTVENGLYYKFMLLQRELYGKTSHEIGSIILRQAVKSTDNYTDLMHGFLYGILTSPSECLKYLQLGLSCVNDEWGVLVEQLKYFTFTKFLYLRPIPQGQIFWLVDKLVSLSVKGCDGLVIGLLRQIRAGNRCESNMQVIGSVVDLIRAHLNWVLDHPSMIPYILYPFLRILSEDNLPMEIQRNIIEVVTTFLYQKFRECALLGRELARCLLEVSKIPEIAQFWQWLLRTKESDGPPIIRILLTPTPRKYLAMRLTPKTETYVQFLLSEAKNYQQSFFFNLFSDLCIPQQPVDDPGSFISDLIRYIVVAQHPSNEILSSGVIQRWSFISSLLKNIKSNYSAASAKLSLFLDWFVFDPKQDNIMCLEAGLLVMAKAIVGHPNITATLLEYLELSHRLLYPPMQNEFKKSMDLAMSYCISKGVIPSLDGLLYSPMLSEDVKEITKGLFSMSIPRASVTPRESKESKFSIAMSKLEDTLGRNLSEEAIEVIITDWLEAINDLINRKPIPDSELKRLSYFVNKDLYNIIMKAETDAVCNLWIRKLSDQMDKYSSLKSMFNFIPENSQDRIIKNYFEQVTPENILNLLSEISTDLTLSSQIDSNIKSKFWAFLYLAEHIGSPKEFVARSILDSLFFASEDNDIIRTAVLKYFKNFGYLCDCLAISIDLLKRGQYDSNIFLQISRFAYLLSFCIDTSCVPKLVQVLLGIDVYWAGAAKGILRIRNVPLSSVNLELDTEMDVAVGKLLHSSSSRPVIP